MTNTKLINAIHERRTRYILSENTGRPIRYMSLGQADKASKKRGGQAIKLGSSYALIVVTDSPQPQNSERIDLSAGFQKYVPAPNSTKSYYERWQYTFRARHLADNKILLRCRCDDPHRFHVVNSSGNPSSHNGFTVWTDEGGNLRPVN